MAGHVLAYAYVSEAGAGMHGHAHTMGEWAGKAAGGASGGQWQAGSWCMPMQVRLVCCAGMRIPACGRGGIRPVTCEGLGSRNRWG